MGSERFYFVSDYVHIFIYVVFYELRGLVYMRDKKRLVQWHDQRCYPFIIVSEFDSGKY